MPREYENQKPNAFQRLPEYTRDDAWIKALLHRGQIARIASRFDANLFINTSTFLYLEAEKRIIFHSNIVGRVRANIEKHPEVCIEVSEFGKLLPSNIALEFSVQYRSVVVFGKACLIEDDVEKKKVLHQLIQKYFSPMQIDKDYRSATEKELKRTSVYEIQIESWSGKENWKEITDQSDEWAPLEEKWFEHFRR